MIFFRKRNTLATKQTGYVSMQRKHRNICPLLLKNCTLRVLFKFFFLIRTVHMVFLCHLCVLTVTAHKTKPLIFIKQTVYTTVHSKEKNLYKLSKQYFCPKHNSHSSSIHSKLLSRLRTAILCKISGSQNSVAEIQVFGIWRVIRRAVPYISKDHRAFTFRVKESK